MCAGFVQIFVVFFFKQKTAYDMRISDWSSDVCSSDLEIPFTFTVLDSDVVNAFALPGGYIYVTRGLLALANSEAEMAGVLAHEISHVTEIGRASCRERVCQYV